MEMFYEWLNTLVNRNRSDFAQWPDINWVNLYNSRDFQQQRDDLLSKIGDSVLFKGTKPYHKQISQGCSICGSGKWNCLFITNKCNAHCFYCPASQKQDEIPSSQGLDFKTANEYAEFIRYFDFNGVSFSGGEPLLFFDRTLEYLKAVRNICKPELYVWMYTNGILAEKEKLTQLANAGLNEIRFDIGATGFNLDRVKIAKDIIPNVTIEIPAIPEEKEKLIELLPKMVEAGVTNLNLHQLRLTQHNASKIVQRGYSIINAEKPIVLESELAALEIVDYAREHSIDIGINYCSFFFKHRFQKAGYKKQLASKLSPNASITQNGFLRKNTEGTILYASPRLTADEAVEGTEPVLIGQKKYFYKEEQVWKKNSLSGEERAAIEHLQLQEPSDIPSDADLFKIWQMEYLEEGLREY